MPDDLNRLEEDGEDLLKGIIDHPDDDDALEEEDAAASLVPAWRQPKQDIIYQKLNS